MPSRSLRPLLIALACAVVIAAAWWQLREVPVPPARTPHLSATPAPMPATTLPRTAAEARAQGKTPETSPLLRAAPDRPALVPLAPAPEMATASRLADKLNAREGSGVEDLRIVFDLFRHYREEYGGFPTGEDNAAIVNALTGNNPQRMAFIPREHPAINAQGEMVDRWQKPLFFHIIGSDAVEIRSAGPDGEMYSPDDLLQRSPGLEQPMPGAPEP